MGFETNKHSCVQGSSSYYRCFNDDGVCKAFGDFLFLFKEIKQDAYYTTAILNGFVSSMQEINFRMVQKFYPQNRTFYRSDDRRRDLSLEEKKFQSLLSPDILEVVSHPNVRKVVSEVRRLILNIESNSEEFILIKLQLIRCQMDIIDLSLTE